MNQLSINLEIKNPTNNTQEVLYALIQKGSVSLEDFPYLSGFRTRVSELKNRHGVSISSELKKGKLNKFGRPTTVAVHTLDNEDKEAAIRAYKQLCDAR